MKKYGIIALILILTVGLLTGCRPAGKSKRTIQKEMKAYLETEYNSEAYVGKPVLSGNTGFGYHKYSAEAYLKNDPDIKFYVSYRISDGAITAGYHTVRLIEDGKKAMQEELSRFYDPEEILDVYFMIHFSPDFVRTEDMTYESLVENHRGEYSISLSYQLAVKKLDENLEIERIKKFLGNYEIKNETNKLTLSIRYWNEKYREEFYKTFIRQNPKNPIEMGALFGRFYYHPKFHNLDLNNLNELFIYED